MVKMGMNYQVFNISIQNIREMKAKFNVMVEQYEDGYYVATVPSLTQLPYPGQEPG